MAIWGKNAAEKPGSFSQASIKGLQEAPRRSPSPITPGEHSQRCGGSGSGDTAGTHGPCLCSLT